MVDKINFLDYVELFLKSGNGGDGAIAFLREAHNARGGPSGGDGGDGGDVIIISDKNVRSLAKFRFIHHLKAENGAPGSGKNKTGKRGKDLIITVPVGTIVYDEHHKLIYDFKKNGEKIILLKGGKGGFGNVRFKSSKRQKPFFALKGEKTKQFKFIFELKLLADVALVGFPNAGKSTLISKISNAKPKIANYPFTTLAPHLGMVYLENGKDYIMADIPGLIEGAHLGRGIGHLFLKHIERCRMLVFLLDPTNKEQRDIKLQYEKLIYELKHFNKILLERPRLIVINKIDTLSNHEKQELEHHFKKAIYISAKENINLQNLKYEIYKILQSVPIDEREGYREEIKVLYKSTPIVEKIEFIDGKYYVRGRIEKDVERIDFQHYDALYFFKQYLKLHGIKRIFKKHNIKDGDIVVIGNNEFIYYEEE